jgi:ABC-type nitrate/sulfonate/bicarbonate transport system substrate-binding protein
MSVTLAPTRSSSSRSHTLRLGYVRLTDAAPLLVADTLGLFRAHGLDVSLTPMMAWAAMRDRVAFGQVDGAQMLSPLVIAGHLGLGGVQHAMSVVSTLNRNGNTITLGETLMGEMAPEDAALRPLPARALADVLARRRAAGRGPTPIAIVHPFSSHNYLLRHWLSSAGIDPERDVRLVAVPPPLVADRLADGSIEGFCAGEPWGSRAVDLQVGRIVLTTADIWPNHPEKVFALSEDAVQADRPRAVAAVAALMQAGRWLDEPGNHPEATRILCDAALADVPAEVVAMALTGRLRTDPDGPVLQRAGLVFHRDGATYPDPAHGAWWLGQMRAWQHLPPSLLPGADDATLDELPERIWRPEIWREAAALLGETAPSTDLASPTPR